MPSDIQNPSTVASLVLLNTVSPSKLADDLIIAGHQVWEALSVSEVLYLCEQHKIDVTVITAEVEQAELIEKQLRGIVMRLQRDADAAYVHWELSQLFHRSSGTIQ